MGGEVFVKKLYWIVVKNEGVELFRGKHSLFNSHKNDWFYAPCEVIYKDLYLQ